MDTTNIETEVIEEVTSQEDIQSFNLVIDWTYEWYKTILLDLAKQREKLEVKMRKYVDKIKAWIREQRNRNRLQTIYWQIEEITILWFHLLEEAYKDFPTEVENDKDLPRGNRDSVDFFAEERAVAKQELDRKFDETIQSILPQQS